MYGYSKQQLRDCGVYQIVNVVDGKRYIGSTSRTFRQRWNSHLSQLRLGKHHCKFLQSAWNKHGEESFRFSVVEVTHADDAVTREQFFIDSWNTSNSRFGYNIAKVAGSVRGLKHTDASKLKMRASQRARRNRIQPGPKQYQHVAQPAPGIPSIAVLSAAIMKLHPPKTWLAAALRLGST